jgi:hypothetical protein
MMAKAWTCDNESRLRAIFSIEPKLASRLVPCRHWQAEGRVLLQPHKALPPALAARATDLGLQAIQVEPPKDAAEAVSPWQLFALEEAPLPEKLGEEPVPILFLCPDNATVVDLAARILELGCDQMRAGSLPGGLVALWAAHPPLFVVLTALDQPRTRVLYEQSPGVFSPLRARHPFLDGLVVAQGTWLMLEVPTGHTCLQQEALQPLDQHWQLLQAEHEALQPADWDQRIPVPLTLIPSSLPSGKECLWKIDSELLPTFLEWVSQAPEEQLCQLEWMALGTGANRSFLVRPLIQTAPVSLPVFSAAYERAHPMESIFIPSGTRLCPPLRVERLRQAAGLGPGMIAWLETDTSHPQRLAKSHTVAAAAFRSLESCLEYQLAAEPEVLEAWQESIGFSDLEEMVLEPIQTSAVKPRHDRETPVASSRPVGEVPGPTTGKAPTAEIPPAAKKRKKTATKPAPGKEGGESNHASVQASLALEHWLEKPGALHDPDRMEQVGPLAQILSGAHRHRDASDILLLHWWARSPLREPWTNAGIAAITSQEREALTQQAGALAEEIFKNPALLVRKEGITGENRVAASRWLALDIASRGTKQVPSPDWSGLLEQAEPWMPVRHAWVAWMNWRAITGDVQALALAHDRLLRRLAQGLEVGRDSPPFLSGRLLRERGGRSDAGRLLEAMRESFSERVPLRESDQADRMTGALAKALFAAGALRAGEPSQAATLWENAAASLEGEGPLGKVLRAAVEERLAQIRANMPQDQTPRAFAPDATRGLSATDRYRLDNLRKVLNFLEPSQSINPVSHYLAGLTAASGTNPLRDRAVGIQNASAEQVRPLLAAGLNDLETLLAGNSGGQADELDNCLQLLQSIQERAGQATVEIAKRSLLLGNLLTRRLLEGTGNISRERSMQFCLRLLRGALHAAGPWGLRDEVDKWLHAALEPDVDSPGLFALLAQTGQGRLVGSLLQEMVARLRAWDMETAGFALVDGLEKVVGLTGPEDQASLRLILAAQLARRGQTERADRLVEQSMPVITQARESRQPLRGPAVEQRLELARALVMFSLETEPAKGIRWVEAATEMLPALVPPSQGAGLSQAAHGKVLKVVETLVLSLHSARDIEAQSGWCEEEEAMLRRVILAQARIALP